LFLIAALKYRLPIICKPAERAAMKILFFSATLSLQGKLYHKLLSKLIKL